MCPLYNRLRLSTKLANTTTVLSNLKPKFIHYLLPLASPFDEFPLSTDYFFDGNSRFVMENHTTTLLRRMNMFFLYISNVGIYMRTIKLLTSTLTKLFFASRSAPLLVVAFKTMHHHRCSSSATRFVIQIYKLRSRSMISTSTDVKICYICPRSMIFATIDIQICELRRDCRISGEIWFRVLKVAHLVLWSLSPILEIVCCFFSQDQD